MKTEHAYQQCEPAELQAIASAKDYETLRDIAMEQLIRMTEAIEVARVAYDVPPIGVVCGPISNGGVGRGDRIINLLVFGRAVEHFVAERHGYFLARCRTNTKSAN